MKMVGENGRKMWREKSRTKAGKCRSKNQVEKGVPMEAGILTKKEAEETTKGSEKPNCGNRQFSLQRLNSVSRRMSEARSFPKIEKN